MENLPRNTTNNHVIINSKYLHLEAEPLHEVVGILHTTEDDLYHRERRLYFMTKETFKMSHPSRGTYILNALNQHTLNGDAYVLFDEA